MSKYTTGEIAKLCGVTVRTVQYYDSRGILTPSELSEGGRRLYSESDLRTLKIICFLRDLGLSINSIAELLSEKDPGSVISILLEQQEKALRAEIRERQETLETLLQMEREVRAANHFSVESIGDIAHVMENKNKLKKVRWIMVAVGIPMDIIEIATIVIWVKTGLWWPFAAGMCIVAVLGVWISRYYYKRVAYICPQCHKVFKPRFREMFFASHTPRTRKLACPHCGHRGFCVETYDQTEEL